MKLHGTYVRFLSGAGIAVLGVSFWLYTAIMTDLAMYHTYTMRNWNDIIETLQGSSPAFVLIGFALMVIGGFVMYKAWTLQEEEPPQKQRRTTNRAAV